MKIGTLSMCKAKSMLMQSFIDFTKCLRENVDERSGYSWYRGVIYSYGENIFVGLLGADIEGRYRFVEIAYDGSNFIQRVKGIINEDKICQQIETLLVTIEKMPTPLSKIYFDFNEKVDVAYSSCYVFEDLDEPGSQIMLIETDKSMVDTYMLKSAAVICPGTLLCDGWTDAYNRLLVFSGHPDEVTWFKKRGVRVV